MENIFTISIDDIKSVMNSDKKEFVVHKNQNKKLKISSTLLPKTTDIMIWKKSQYELMVNCSRQGGCGAESMNLKFSLGDNFYLFDLKDFNIGSYKLFYSVKDDEMIVFDLLVK
ncbi:hypothetical protein GCM10011344_05360 [Dokdonia pacifica]|nr:hypothetical protein GCM10011344_05360 [Dokdonia pacifica]